MPSCPPTGCRFAGIQNHLFIIFIDTYGMLRSLYMNTSLPAFLMQSLLLKLVSFKTDLFITDHFIIDHNSLQTMFITDHSHNRLLS